MFLLWRNVCFQSSWMNSVLKIAQGRVESHVVVCAGYVRGMCGVRAGLATPTPRWLSLTSENRTWAPQRGDSWPWPRGSTLVQWSAFPGQRGFSGPQTSSGKTRGESGPKRDCWSSQHNDGFKLLVMATANICMALAVGQPCCEHSRMLTSPTLTPPHVAGMVVPHFTNENRGVWVN